MAGGVREFRGATPQPNNGTHPAADTAAFIKHNLAGGRCLALGAYQTSTHGFGKTMEAQVFISHSHADAALAEALVEVLLAATDLAPERLRCTSVPGHQLPFGRTIAEQLKSDIDTTSAVLVLLTQNSLQSKWVLFELGATWALGKVVIPILGHGLTLNDLPGPLANYPSVQIDSLDVKNRLSDALMQIAAALHLNQRLGGKREAKLQKFVDVARSLPGAQATDVGVEEAMAFEIPWLILIILGGGAEYPDALYPQVEAYMSKLGLASSQPLSARVRPGDDGREAMKLVAELGGSLAAKRPDLVRAYEAGANLAPLAIHGKASEIKRVAQRIPLPENLIVPRDDLLEWVNEIHKHMVRPLGLGE